MRDPQETSLELRVRASCCSMLGAAGAAPMLAWRARGQSRMSCVLPSFHILCSVASSTVSFEDTHCPRYTHYRSLCCMKATCSVRKRISCVQFYGIRLWSH